MGVPVISIISDAPKGSAFSWLQQNIARRSSLLCEECQAEIVPTPFCSSFKVLCLLSCAGLAGSLREIHTF